MLTKKETSVFVPLDNPPSAISLTVRSLLDRLYAGRLRLPAFQRPLRWRAQDVVGLFDSISRGYPIGSLLFWRKPADADPNLKIGGATLEVPEADDAWWIIDGQQRITALAAALLDLDHGGDQRWVIRYHPRKQEFLWGPVMPEETGVAVPLSVLGDLRRLGRWLRAETCRLEDEEIRNVESTQQKILDYNLSAYLMETSKPEALQGVFARLNSTGVRMRADEVFQALLGNDAPHHGGIDLNRLQAACNRDGFGLPPRQEVLKAVLAISGRDPARRLQVLDEDALTELVDQAAIEEALQRTVEFLQDPPESAEPGCGIPCYDFIPYPVVFSLLSKFFHLFPYPPVECRKELSKWLWRGFITGAHQRAAVSRMREQARLIAGDSPDQVVEGLLRFVSEPGGVDWSLERFDSRNARSRIEILALLSLGPRYRDGQAVLPQGLVSLEQRVAREIVRVPDKNRAKLAPETRRLVLSAANRALLDTSHTGLQRELRTWDPQLDAVALQSHLLDEETWRCLAEDELDGFLRRRAPRVRNLVSTFLTDRAGLGSPFLAPISRYMDTEPDSSQDE